MDRNACAIAQDPTLFINRVRTQTLIKDSDNNISGEKNLTTLLNLAKDEHSTRIASLGMLFLGFKENKKYSKTKLGKILDNLKVSKERNITLLITKAEGIKKANFEYESGIEIDMFDFYEKGFNSENSNELIKEIRNIFVIISQQFLIYIKEIEKSNYEPE